MSKKIGRWLAHALAAGVVIAGVVVGTGVASGSTAGPAPTTPPAPTAATGNGGIWIGP